MTTIVIKAVFLTMYCGSALNDQSLMLIIAASKGRVFEKMTLWMFHRSTKSLRISEVRLAASKPRDK